MTFVKELNKVIDIQGLHDLEKSRIYKKYKVESRNLGPNSVSLCFLGRYSARENYGFCYVRELHGFSEGLRKAKKKAANADHARPGTRLAEPV